MMWASCSDNAFVCEPAFVADRHGAFQWVVAIKGTYLIGHDGRTRLVDEADQEPVHLAPEHTGDALKTGLKHECELDYTRRCTDVLLHGHAHAPGGRPATQVDVAMQVGPIAKTLRVFGDRQWKRGVTGANPSAPEPFARMPITYERAYGGWDIASDDPSDHGFEPRNPVGTGFATSSGRTIGQAVANIEHPGQLIGSWKDRPEPAGFGPIARSWSPRRELAGTYDAAWERDRLPLLPQDFDERFFQCAPVDQQAPGFLRGDEPVVLRNLTPEGELHFRLPIETFVLRTRINKGWVEQRPELHAVTLYADARRVVMLWKSSLPCHAHRLTIEGTTVLHKPRVRAIGEAVV